MSATAQCTKPKSEAATWTTLFEDVDTSATKSVLFMKKLLALGVSNILFWRGLLPEAAFGERMIGDNPLKILRNEKECPAALKIISWIKASFEPITKCWLRNFYLVIRDKDDMNTIETYTFKFQYTDDDVETEIYRNNKKLPGVEGKTMTMLANISAVVKPLGAAPLPCMLSVDMDFNRPTPEVDIPKDAGVPGFIPIPELVHKFDGKRLAVSLGDINTAYHDCKLQIRTLASRLNIERESQSQQLSKTNSLEERVKEDGSREASSPSKRKRSADTVPLCGSQEKVNRVQSKTPKIADSNVEDINGSAVESEAGSAVSCFCAINDSDLDAIHCTNCHDLHHLVCYGIPSYMDSSRDLEHVKDCFLCFHCSPYLQEIYEFSGVKFKDTCLVRQVLAYLADAGSDQRPADNDILKENKFIMKRLLSEKILIKRKGKGIVLNQPALNKADGVYFDALRTISDWYAPMQAPTALVQKSSKKKRLKKSSAST